MHQERKMQKGVVVMNNLVACVMRHARGQGRRLGHDKVRSAVNFHLEFGEKRSDDVDILPFQ